MRLAFLVLFAVSIGCGVSQARIRDAVELNTIQAQAHADLAAFSRTLYMKAERAAPESSKKFWQDALAALDRNVDQFAKASKDLQRLILTMEELDPATQQKYIDQLTDLIILAKTGKVPEGAAGSITPATGGVQ